MLNPFNAKCGQGQISTKFPIFIVDKQIAPWESTGRVHLNGHIIGFRPQTQKLESPYKTPSNTLAVKGLKVLQIAQASTYMRYLKSSSLILISWTFHKNDLAVTAFNVSPTEVLFSIVLRIIASLNLLNQFC